MNYFKGDSSVVIERTDLGLLNVLSHERFFLFYPQTAVFSLPQSAKTMAGKRKKYSACRTEPSFIPLCDYFIHVFSPTEAPLIPYSQQKLCSSTALLSSLSFKSGIHSTKSKSRLHCVCMERIYHQEIYH